MNVLYSTQQFNEKYQEKRSESTRVALATGGGLVTAAGGVGAAATAAATTSAWTLGSSLPMIGSFCAGKAAAAGFAAACGAPVLIPVVIGAAGVGYLVYKTAGSKHCVGTVSPVEKLADAFARIAFLPAIARIVKTCQQRPEGRDELWNRLATLMKSWGYADEYIGQIRAEYSGCSPETLRRNYNESQRKLESGNLRVFGCKASELPRDLVKDYAETFEREVA